MRAPLDVPRVKGSIFIVVGVAIMESFVIPLGSSDAEGGCTVVVVPRFVVVIVVVVVCMEQLEESNGIAV